MAVKALKIQFNGDQEAREVSERLYRVAGALGRRFNSLAELEREADRLSPAKLQQLNAQRYQLQQERADANSGVRTSTITS